MFSNGIVTGSDSKFISSSRQKLIEGHDDRDLRFTQPVSYRLFEHSYIYYDTKLLERARADVMDNYVGHDNLGFLVTKAFRDRNFAHIWVTKSASEAICLSGTTASNAMNFPLTIFPPDEAFGDPQPNISPKIFREICSRLGVDPKDGPFPIRLFDYIYGALHCPEYRRRYRQALSIDFPHIPYPASSGSFAHVANKGEQLRRLHLMEDSAIGATPYSFKGDGDNIVVKPAFEVPPDVSTSLDTNGVGRVRINPDQWFDDVPRVAWEFYIGGYQPAQKWLKDRKGRTLSFDEVMHYRKIIKILVETDRIMNEIELPLG